MDVAHTTSRIGIPSWLSANLNPTARTLERLHPYPFAHPSDTSPYVCLQENDYLRLSEHPEVQQARLVEDHGETTTMASSIFAGSPEHVRLCQALGAAMQAEDVLLTCSGWSANVGLVDALARPGTPVYLDQKAHASLWDGARMAGAQLVMVRHNDPASLEQRIRRHGPGIVCVDAWYSTTGAATDLRRTLEICEAHDCVLILDEAHSFGMTGQGGGLAVEEGLAQRVHFRTLSFSKALGGHGGCIATSRHLGWLLTHRAHPLVFSSSVLPSDCAAHLAALRVALREPERARNALDMAQLFRQELTQRGIEHTRSTCQIVSVLFPTMEDACTACLSLREHLVLASVFAPPAVPEGTGLIRFSFHSQVTPQQVRQAAQALEEALRELRTSSVGHAA